MSYIDDIEIYNDPIITRKRKGSSDNEPYLEIAEMQIVDAKGKVLLTEIPNKKERVIVKNASTYLYETDETELTITTFKVDYPNGVVSFHTDLAGTNLTFKYFGEGAKYFPVSRVWVEDEENKVTTGKDKFDDIDRLIDEQKARVDNLIVNNPQPSEIVDVRVDRNGTTYTVAKDRIDAEQLKIDNLVDEIEDAYVDLDMNVYTSIKDRIDAVQQDIKDLNTTLSAEIDAVESNVSAIRTEINNTYNNGRGGVFTSLSGRINDVDNRLVAIEGNITSLEDSLTLKVDGTDFNGENIISKIEMTPSNILISSSKIDLVGSVGVNALDDTLYAKVNDAIQASNINLTGSLPTSVKMDSNGITAYTSDTTKYSRLNQNGLYVKNGALTIERSDGYKFFENGVANFDFGVDSADPPFMDSGVSVEGYWFKTTSTTPLSGNYYTFKRTGRYLKMQIAYYKTGEGNTGGIRIAQNGGGLLFSKSFTNGLVDSVASVGEVITVDLGVPNGEIFSVYLQGYQDVNSGVVYFRKIRAWVEG